MTKASRKPLMGIILLTPFFLLLMALFFYLRLTAPAGRGEEKIFVINRGEALKSIASRLQRERIVNNRYVFLFEAWRLKLTNKIQAGTYRLKDNLSSAEIVKQLTVGKLDEWVTLLEGWRREEMIEAIAKKITIDKEKFLALTKDKEGMLFPDSYLFPEDASEEKVIGILTNNFEKKFAPLGEVAKTRGLGPEEALIFASLVEREAKGDQDRAIVAGILIKRWQSDWPLQVDAAVQYAIASKKCRLIVSDCDWWPNKITKTDLEIDSPYNTYKYKELPPTPICNPSLKSLQAVANYQESDYWFYLSDAQGKIHFAKSIEEHNKNIRTYLGS